MPLDKGFRVVGTSLYSRGISSIGFTGWNLNDNFNIGKHVIYVIKTEIVLFHKSNIYIYEEKQ